MRSLRFALVTTLAVSSSLAQCPPPETLKVTGLSCLRDRFGVSLAIWGDTAVVGSHEAYVSACRQGFKGKVWVYRRDAATKTWKLDTVLAPKRPRGHGFGYAVAIYERTIVVAGDGAGGVTGGATWVFEKVAGTWKSTELPHPGYQVTSFDCAIAKDLIAVAAGAYPRATVRIYEKPSAGWTSVPSLQPKWELKPPLYAIPRADSIALSGNRLAVAWTVTRPTKGTRAAVYDLFFGNWISRGTIAFDGPINSIFGGLVDVHEDLALVAQWRTRAAFLFQREQSGKWVRRATFTGLEYNYGSSIALSKDAATRGRVIIGANDRGGIRGDHAYVYDPVDPVKLDRWTTRKLTAGTRGGGRVVALHGRWALTGDEWSSYNYGAEHRAYAFEIGDRRQSGNIELYGEGCKGSGGKIPSHAASGSPEIGRDLTWTLSNARANAPVVFLVGGVRTNTPLDQIGMTGCRLLTDPVVQLGRVTDASGSLTVKVTLPCELKAVGSKVTSQLAVVDPGAPHPLKVVSSNGLEVTIGGFH